MTRRDLQKRQQDEPGWFRRRITDPALIGGTLAAVLIIGVVGAAWFAHDNPRPRASCSTLYWTTSWMAAPDDSSARVPADPAPFATPHDAVGGYRAFTNQTLRMIVSPHLTGGQAR